MGLAVLFGVADFLEGVLVDLFVLRVFGSVVGLDEKFQGCRIDAPLFGEDSDHGFGLGAGVEDIDEVLIDEVRWIVLILLPDGLQDLGTCRIRLAEAGDFFVDLLDDLLVLGGLIHDESRLIRAGSIHESQDVVFIDLVDMVAAELVVDRCIDLWIIVRVILFEFFLDVVELSAVLLDGLLVNLVVLRQILVLELRVDLQIGVSIVKRSISLQELELLLLAEGIDFLWSLGNGAKLLQGFAKILLGLFPRRCLYIVATTAGNTLPMK